MKKQQDSSQKGSKYTDTGTVRSGARRQKKLALINDLSGFGRCSITVELPIVSALRVQGCILPTSIFSNHTGYPSFFCEDFTQNMEPFMQEWEKLQLHFDGICSGYLGSARQIAIVKKFLSRFYEKNTIFILDPVMGDNGRLYTSYQEETSRGMRELVQHADILTPNLTEACILTGEPYREDFHRKQLQQMAEKLSAMGPDKVVITGIQQGSYIANFCYESGRESVIVRTAKAGTQRCGTGDIFTSIIAADAVNGEDFFGSVRKAADFVKKCIRKSVELEIPLTDGVCFEEILTTLH